MSLFIDNDNYAQVPIFMLDNRPSKYEVMEYCYIQAIILSTDTV